MLVPRDALSYFSSSESFSKRLRSKDVSSLNPNQAYLKINNGTSSEIKTFFSLGGDYVNDINHIETEILSDNIGAYNLNGQRITSLAKGGLYIMNGKKVFVR